MKKLILERINDNQNCYNNYDMSLEDTIKFLEDMLIDNQQDKDYVSVARIEKEIKILKTDFEKEKDIKIIDLIKREIK